MKEHVYRNNKIIQYGPTTFLASMLDEDGDVITSLKRTLESAKKWIDQNLG